MTYAVELRKRDKFVIVIVVPVVILKNPISVVPPFVITAVFWCVVLPAEHAGALSIVTVSAGPNTSVVKVMSSNSRTTFNCIVYLLLSVILVTLLASVPENAMVVYNGKLDSNGTVSNCAAVPDVATRPCPVTGGAADDTTTLPLMTFMASLDTVLVESVIVLLVRLAAYPSRVNVSVISGTDITRFSVCVPVSCNPPPIVKLPSITRVDTF